MINSIISFSIKNKLIVILFTIGIVVWGGYSISVIPIGAVPDITNNQVQILTTSRNLATQDVEQFITYPVELEMANLPGVKEIRSISKFGISVVTVVFDDNMGTYLPRQLIAEKIKSASEKIPEAFGSPEMGPVTTGLGEIYQYILDVEPGYDSIYSPMDLRTIQDWVVKRQLSGVPGVVEINTWGGFLKQYEVAIDPEKLNSAGLELHDVFKALEMNNDVIGGAYIEKLNKSYFIRGEGMTKSLEDIEHVVVKTMDGIPIYVKDIAKVQMGSANRFGAITGNGEGEKVMGQVMMLKDANSNQVIKAVKERVADIQMNLPEGVVINPFLERSELIAKTTSTVSENLILGALIVIFVLVVLLGNLRSGLIVASVIPISLLFAISLMNLFGVSANLMSLGAIDFGIIIDGAVIIIEFIVFKINDKKAALEGLDKHALQSEKDIISRSAASKMMRSAIFGQIIILIVFIPILSLSDIEGKMFRPMALSFGFALIGAMIMCLTYVPVMASLICKPSKEGMHNFSNRIIEKIQKVYQPVIQFALRSKALVIGIAVSLLVVSAVVFIRMGGEFVPTLDEGDYVVQPVLKTGTSLGQTIEITTQLEKILLDNFPEVDQVVTRIGAAEVPTDPMSMGQSDVIIKLKPKSEWVSARSKDGLADKMKAAMAVVPGIDFEFTQPIEMRFNELITGVRTDVAIKIYGEDLDVLYEYANKVEKLIRNVEGAADISVEKVAGLPQMSVEYDRKKIAHYGLNIAEVNNTLSMAFAGTSAGTVFEGEKRFDLVVRLDKGSRGDIEDIKNLYIDTPGGNRIPLREVANIEYKTGPAQISRDNTSRRIVVGINVRNRDIESMVEEIQEILNVQLNLPSGYYMTFGGQFENLQHAKERLMIAVPLALVLIFVMLYFTFGSFRQALLVYSAIPLAAIGGILFLWLRDLPFSISAGVGFIALFGIAVLNGIVLIDFFNELKMEGVKDIRERVLKGTTMRLRPVLLTATAAAMGFFPMAFSTSAGAEVQRPLATVVIGGLITATLLTLVVLPVLYTIFNKERDAHETENATNSKKISLSKGAFLIGFFMIMGSVVKAQNAPMNLEEITALALKHNAALKASQLSIEKQKALKGSTGPGKTDLYYAYDENNVTEAGVALDVFGIRQGFSFPIVYSAQNKLNQRKVQVNEINYQMTEMQLKKKLSQTYYGLQYQMNRMGRIVYLDSLYQRFQIAVTRKLEVGDGSYLEKLTAGAKLNEVKSLKRQVTAQVDALYEQLNGLVQNGSPVTIQDETLTKISNIDSTAISNLAGSLDMQFFDAMEGRSEAAVLLEKRKRLPDLNVQYFNGFGDSQTFQGYQFGVSLPLWPGTRKSRIRSQKIQTEIIQRMTDDHENGLRTKMLRLRAQINEHDQNIQYYETQGLRMADEIFELASKSYTLGETDYLQYVQSLKSAQEITLSYLENLNQYNQAILELKYLSNFQTE
ncbi:CusA/CzcA family heavy metal efflux RND transporter [Fulvivirgaceae bacterium BMA10]|uniref:CusA/CzcA family heavy metal efflux RND transporter n=1 Tax=Splendidivirga corallicola TaxID=3051826 RepID=A0ABT8KXW0_9BACT|nr:CusA/CzcA family heavy metal efflux RND transporter [Fulvivirgaceae bacterium BMA10]